MNTIIGLGLALVLAWASIQLGALLRKRYGIGFGQYVAAAAGIAAGLVIWLPLHFLTGIPGEIVNGLGIGTGVGLFSGLRPSADAKKQ